MAWGWGPKSEAGAGPRTKHHGTARAQLWSRRSGRAEQTWTLDRVIKPCASLGECPRPKRQLQQAQGRTSQPLLLEKSRLGEQQEMRPWELGGMITSDPEATAGALTFTLHEQGRERKVQSRREHRLMEFWQGLLWLCCWEWEWSDQGGGNWWRPEDVPSGCILKGEVQDCMMEQMKGRKKKTKIPRWPPKVFTWANRRVPLPSAEVGNQCTGQVLEKRESLLDTFSSVLLIREPREITGRSLQQWFGSWERESVWKDTGGYIMLEIWKSDLLVSLAISQPHKQVTFLPSCFSLCQSFRTHQFISPCPWSLVLNSTVTDETS